MPLPDNIPTRPPWWPNAAALDKELAAQWDKVPADQQALIRAFLQAVATGTPPAEVPARPTGWPRGDELDAQLDAVWANIPAAQRVLLRAAVDAIVATGASIRVTVGNLKGGVSKSTTVVHIAFVLSLTGDPVLAIDADPTNHSVLMWAETAGEGWPANIQVLPWATPDIPKRVKAIQGQFKHLIGDTAPGHEDLLRSVLHVSNTFLISSGPTPMDVSQLFKSIDAATEVDGIKPDGLASVIMLTRAKKGTNLLRDAQTFFDAEERQWPYLTSVITDRVGHAEALGAVPWEWTDYGPAIAEFIAFELELDVEAASTSYAEAGEA